MREICIVGTGDSVKKLSYKLGINPQASLQEDLVIGYRYVVLQEGSDDIQVVKNYNPYFISNSCNPNTLIEKGYFIVGACCDRVVYYQPSGVKYSVKPLDTLENISKIFGVSIEDIMVVNKLNTKKLFVGQVLYL